MLAALDDAGLVALASKGLLRRARAALKTPGAVRLCEANETGAVLEIEGHEVTLDPRGLPAARCSCPATGLCRHVLMAALTLRAREAAPGSEASAPRPTALDEIRRLTRAEIEAFAGADWPRAQRIAAASRQSPQEADATSLVVTMEGAPGPVTFLAGGGLKAARFKGPDAQRRRFVAAAALIVSGHAPEAPPETSAPVDKDLLKACHAALDAALHHGLRGDPGLARDRLFDLATSARAEAAPRLAATLRDAAALAGRLANRDPKTDPTALLLALATCHALTRALAAAPGDPALTGQLRRDYQPAPALDLAVLGLEAWRSPSGARGLTIHGLAAGRFLASGPARLAGTDPGFDPANASQLPWWPGLTPAAMTGRVLHLPHPLIAPDGMLSRQCEVAPETRALAPEELGFHDDWQTLRADIAARRGLGLRALTRPVPALIRFAACGAPRRDPATRVHLLDIADRRGAALALELPDAAAATAIGAMQHRLHGALVVAGGDEAGTRFRLVSLFHDGMPAPWNVTLDPVPPALARPGKFDRLRSRSRIVRTPPQTAPGAAMIFADRALRALTDAVSVPPDPNECAALTTAAETLGLASLARRLASLDGQDSAMFLALAWEITLLRRALTKT
ncbi:MAG: hypothetical protein CSA74_01060 [Rhodobacterales bacterium]|nr:MAG: hypothetical protein CSA74_01060 [Rhodobacterales bacterium]